MQKTGKILAGVLLTFFVGGMFVSLFHLTDMMNMEGGAMMGTNDCLFASHEETVCPMNLMDHISAWNDTFVAVVPGFVGLMVAASLLTGTISLAPNLLTPPRYFRPFLLRCLRERTYTFIYRLWQELFSNGILNPKLF